MNLHHLVSGSRISGSTDVLLDFHQWFCSLWEAVSADEERRSSSVPFFSWGSHRQSCKSEDNPELSLRPPQLRARLFPSASWA